MAYVALPPHLMGAAAPSTAPASVASVPVTTDPTPATTA
jgi:hypothetical protein